MWESEKWYQKLRMDAKAQGTGFKEMEVDKVAMLPLADLLRYIERVAQTTQDYLKTLKDTELDNIPNPNRPL